MARQTTYYQDSALRNAIIDPERDMTFLVEVIEKHFTPEQVFSLEELSTWAENNGFANIEILTELRAEIAEYRKALQFYSNGNQDGGELALHVLDGGRVSIETITE